MARVEIFPARPLQCYRSPETGRVKQQCSSTRNRVDDASPVVNRVFPRNFSAPPKCLPFADQNKQTDHRLGGKAAHESHRKQDDVTASRIGPAKRKISTQSHHGLINQIRVHRKMSKKMEQSCQVKRYAAKRRPWISVMALRDISLLLANVNHAARAHDILMQRWPSVGLG